MQPIHTNRLILRDFLPADFDSLLALEGTPSTRYYEVQEATETQVRQFLQGGIDEVAMHPRTHYNLAVCLHDNPEHLIGLVKLALNFPAISEWEIGWALHPAHWRQGYAVEAARAMLDFAFGECKAHRVVAFSHAANAASIRVMQRLGMQRDGILRETRRWQNQWADEVVYSVLEREWG